MLSSLHDALVCWIQPAVGRQQHAQGATLAAHAAVDNAAHAMTVMSTLSHSSLLDP